MDRLTYSLSVAPSLPVFVLLSLSLSLGESPKQVSPLTLTLSALEAVPGAVSSEEVFDSRDGEGTGFSRHADGDERNVFCASGERDAVDWDPCLSGPQLPMRC